MKVQIEEISAIKKRLLIELPRENYTRALDKAYEKLNKKVSIKGFRKGKVPRNILERYYGTQTEMETISQVVDKSYQQAIQENAIVAVDMPKISDLKMEGDSPISFSAEVEVQPKVETRHYEEIPLKKNKLEVTEEEIQKELFGLQKAHAQQIPEEEGGVAANGHIAMINYAGTIDGVPFAGGTAHNTPVVLGAGRFLKDFEEGILGMKKGESKEIEVLFPEDYGHETLRGKKATFKIDLIELKKEVLPNLDDEFAKDIGAFEFLSQVKEELKNHLIKAKESQQRGDLFKQAIDFLIQKNDFEIPSAMIERELDYMFHAFSEQLRQQKVTIQQLGINEEEWRARNREEAVRRIKGFLLFDSIATQQKLTVTEEEVGAKLGEIAAKYKQPVEAIQRHYQENNLLRPLYNQILEEKTLDFLVEKAKIENE